MNVCGNRRAIHCSRRTKIRSDRIIYTSDTLLVSRHTYTHSHSHTRLGLWNGRERNSVFSAASISIRILLFVNLFHSFSIFFLLPFLLLLGARVCVCVRVCFCLVSLDGNIIRVATWHQFIINSKWIFVRAQRRTCRTRRPFHACSRPFPFTHVFPSPSPSSRFVFVWKSFSVFYFKHFVVVVVRWFQTNTHTRMHWSKMYGAFGSATLLMGWKRKFTRASARDCHLILCWPSMSIGTVWSVDWTVNTHQEASEIKLIAYFTNSQHTEPGAKPLPFHSSYNKNNNNSNQISEAKWKRLRFVRFFLPFYVLFPFVLFVFSFRNKNEV